MPGFFFFFRISELLSIIKSSIVTEDLYFKTFVEVSKTDKCRESSWAYIATTGNFTGPYTKHDLFKYLEVARILYFSQDFISDPYGTTSNRRAMFCLPSASLPAEREKFLRRSWKLN